jgi:hypothetical protein
MTGRAEIVSIGQHKAISLIKPAPLRNDPRANCLVERLRVVRHGFGRMACGATARMFIHVDLYHVVPFLAVRRKEAYLVKITHAATDHQLTAIVTTWTRSDCTTSNFISQVEWIDQQVPIIIELGSSGRPSVYFGPGTGRLERRRRPQRSVVVGRRLPLPRQRQSAISEKGITRRIAAALLGNAGPAATADRFAAKTLPRGTSAASASHNNIGGQLIC